MFEQGVPLRKGEQHSIQQQVGVSDWKIAAERYAAPSAYSWDVFISHAGNKADKAFAWPLKQLLEGAGWGLRIFLDDESLQTSTDPAQSMQAAMESTHIALLLFRKEFFEREATKGKLKVLLERHASHRVLLFPVFLRLTVEECAEKIASLLEAGAVRCKKSYQEYLLFTVHCKIGTQLPRK